MSGSEIADEVALLHLVELARAFADRVPHAVLLADLGRIRGDPDEGLDPPNASGEP